MQRHRPMMLAAIMIGILAGSVLVAWWLSELRGAAVRRGREVVRTIRGSGLAAYWPEDEHVAWYLIRRAQSGQPAGWYMVRRRRVPDGYRIWKIAGLDRKYYLEEWRLNPSATISNYEARSLSGQGRGTIIRLNGREATVLWTQGAVALSGTSTVPENYIPEGLNDLAVELAAAGGKEAAFQTIFNEEALGGSRVRFGRVRVEPLGSRRVRVRYRSARAQWEETLWLDDRGRIERSERPEAETFYQRVSAEEVRRAFPEARRLTEEADS
jgi:hypothetical protein